MSASKDDEMTQKIRDAAEAGRIVMGSSTDIDDYEVIARDFLKEVFHLDYDECFISDESSLSDFAGCGVPEGAVPENCEMQEYYDIGRKYTVDKIMETYGIEVQPRDYLITVFEKIRVNRTKLVN